MSEHVAPEPRTFVKKVGDKTLTREVTSAAGEVEARFDGYLEKPAAKSSPAARPASSGSNS